jgi:N utilization substance protein B
MLNRRQIRVKIMQVLYAFKGSESDDFSKDQRFLLSSIDNMYNLYLLLISLFIKIQEKAEDHLEKTQNKHLATPEEKNPNRKFINNKVLQMLRKNEQLEAKLDANSIRNWELDSEYVELLKRVPYLKPIWGLKLLLLKKIKIS